MSASDVVSAAGPAALGRPAGGARAGLRLLRSELRLVTGRRRNQAGLLVLAAVPILLAVAVRASGGGRGRGGDFLTAAASNGIFVALAALTVEIALFLPLAVAILSGDAIAGEANTGTLRYLLTVPVSRTRLLAVKYASLVIGSAIGAAVVAVTGVVIGGILFGLGPVTLLSGAQVPLADGLLRLLVACLYVAVGLSALAAVGLFVSTLTEQPIAVMISVTVVSTAMWILDGISQVEWIHPYLLVHYWPAFADLFREPVFWEQMSRGLLVALAYVVVFLSLAWARFGQKDITS